MYTLFADGNGFRSSFGSLREMYWFRDGEKISSIDWKEVLVQEEYVPTEGFGESESKKTSMKRRYISRTRNCGFNPDTEGIGWDDV